MALKPDPPPKIPQVWGLAFITVYVFFIAVLVLMVFYWKTLSETALTQQIACPLAKYCKEGDSTDGTIYGVSIYFPTSFDDFTNGEILSLPYYDSYSYPVKKTVTITINATDDVPNTGTTYHGKTDVGVSGTFPDYTVYIAGYSTRENISNDAAALLAWAIKSGDTVMKKRAFMRVDSLSSTGSGVTHLNYSIVVSTIDESASDLSVSSSVSSSVLLSGSNNLTFSPAQITKSEGYVNVYGDYNFINKENVVRGLLATDETENDKYNFCVDPGFISNSCIGLAYNPEEGRWYNPDGNPDNPPPDIGSAWASYADTDEVPKVGWCSFHLSPPTREEYPDTIDSENFLYQMNELSEDIMDNVLKNTDEFANLNYTYGGKDLSANNKTSDYVQDIVFCGGITASDNNFEDSNRTNTYNARWPNPTTAASDYTNIGF